MDANDIMTHKPIVISPDTSAHEALEMMLDRDIRHLPVVEGGELIGMLSDRDIQAFVLPDLAGLEEDRSKRLSAIKVRNVMRTDVFSVTPDTELEEIIDIMVEQKVGAVPVVSTSNALVGIISYVDVLKFTNEKLVGNL